MEMPIKYTTTSDGARIAHTSLGGGPPLVWDSGVGNEPFELFLALPTGREWADTVRRGRRFITFNHRGTGRSGPMVGPLTADQLVEDLAAVIETIESPKVDLVAVSCAVPTGCAYVARYPGRVRSLTLVQGGLTRGSRWWQKGISKSDYLLEIQHTARINWDFADDRAQSAFAREVVRAVPFETWTEYDRVAFGVPVDGEIARAILVPTLCLQARDGPAMASELAEIIPGATLGLLDVGLLIAGRSRSALGDALSAFLASLPDAGTSEAPWETVGEVSARPLSRRESEVLSLLAAGRSNAEIAAELTVSATTVARHVSNIYTKLGIHNRAQATAAYLGATTEAHPTT